MASIKQGNVSFTTSSSGVVVRDVAEPRVGAAGGISAANVSSAAVCPPDATLAAQIRSDRAVTQRLAPSARGHDDCIDEAIYSGDGPGRSSSGPSGAGAASPRPTWPRAPGTSQPVVSAYEHGRRDPTFGTLRKLIEAGGERLHSTPGRRPTCRRPRPSTSTPAASRRAVARRRHSRAPSRSRSSRAAPRLVVTDADARAAHPRARPCARGDPARLRRRARARLLRRTTCHDRHRPQPVRPRRPVSRRRGATRRARGRGRRPRSQSWCAATARRA